MAKSPQPNWDRLKFNREMAIRKAEFKLTKAKLKFEASRLRRVEIGIPLLVAFLTIAPAVATNLVLEMQRAGREKFALEMRLLESRLSFEYALREAAHGLDDEGTTTDERITDLTCAGMLYASTSGDVGNIVSRTIDRLASDDSNTPSDSSAYSGSEAPKTSQESEDCS